MDLLYDEKYTLKNIGINDEEFEINLNKYVIAPLLNQDLVKQENIIVPKIIVISHNHENLNNLIIKIWLAEIYNKLAGKGLPKLLWAGNWPVNDEYTFLFGTHSDLKTVLPPYSNHMWDAKDLLSVKNVTLIVVGTFNENKKFELDKYFSVYMKINTFNLLDLWVQNYFPEKFDFDIRPYAERLANCDLQIIQNIIEESRLESLSDETKEVGTIYEDFFFKALSKSQCGKYSSDRIIWDDIVGLNDVKEELKKTITDRVLYKEIYESLNLPKKANILLHGPPGTGKTFLAKALATETSLDFIYVSPDKIFGSLVGETEKNIVKIFNEARRRAPALLFFDEADTFSPK